MINIMEEYETIKRLNVRNKIHANNGKRLLLFVLLPQFQIICFETKEEAQRAIVDINQYPGWKASLYYSRYKMEFYACGLKGHKIKECQTKQNIYIVGLKKTVKSKLEIQEEMQKYGNIKSIKVRRDRHGYEINEAMLCYATQKEAEEAITQINKGTEQHAEIY